MSEYSILTSFPLLSFDKSNPKTWVLVRGFIIGPRFIDSVLLGLVLG